MYESLSLLVLDGWDLNLPKDDSPVRRWTAATLDEVLVEVECDELLVAHAIRARPHARLMLVPVAPRSNDRVSDVVLDVVEGFDRVRMRSMGRVQYDLFARCCKNSDQDRSQRCATADPRIDGVLYSPMRVVLAVSALLRGSTVVEWRFSVARPHHGINSNVDQPGRSSR